MLSQEFLNILLFSSLAGSSTIFGIYLVKRFSGWMTKNSHYLISFAVGVILANAFFDLMPEAAEFLPNYLNYVLGAIIALFILEHFIMIHACNDETCDVHPVGTISTIGIGFHSLIDGIIIGVGFGVSFELGLVTALAVIFHEIPEGSFTYSILRHEKMKEKTAILYSWLVALATPAGALLTYFLILNVSNQLLGALLAMAAGSFIYIGASDLIPETHKKSSFWNILLVISGIIFVLALTQILGSM